MNRQQFAEVAANAYVNQFSTNGSPVMSQAIVTWNGETFRSQSELTPLDDGEYIAMYVNDGMFGDVDADAPDAARQIADYLIDPASNEGWRDVVAMIETAIDNEAAWDAA